MFTLFLNGVFTTMLACKTERERVFSLNFTSQISWADLMGLDFDQIIKMVAGFISAY